MPCPTSRCGPCGNDDTKSLEVVVVKTEAPLVSEAETHMQDEDDLPVPASEAKHAETPQTHLQSHSHEVHEEVSELARLDMDAGDGRNEHLVSKVPEVIPKDVREAGCQKDDHPIVVLEVVVEEVVSQVDKTKVCMDSAPESGSDQHKECLKDIDFKHQETFMSEHEVAVEGTFMEIAIVFLRCMGLAIVSVTIFIVVCVLPLSAGKWFFADQEELASKVHDWLPPSVIEEGKTKRLIAPNISMAILLQTIVQLFANPFYIVMQMRALCGFWGVQDPYVMIPNILYGLWIIIAPLCLQERFWYYWIDFSVGAIYVVVEAIYAYRMIGARAKDVGTIDTGNDIRPFADRPADMTGKMSPAAAIVFSSCWVIAAVYVVVPMTVAGWLGATTSYADSDLMGKIMIMFGLQLMFMVTIPIVRAFLNRFSPLGAVADMLILMHPQIHKSISSRMLISSLDSLGELIITCAVISAMELCGRGVVYPASMRLKAYMGQETKEVSSLYILSRLVDQVLEILCILGCPICMYVFQNETIIFTFATKITFGTMLLQIAIQLGFEIYTDVLCLCIEVFMLKFRMLRAATYFKRNQAYVRFLGYSVVTMGLLYFLYISTKFPRYPCPDVDWCACNGNMDTCFA